MAEDLAELFIWAKRDGDELIDTRGGRQPRKSQVVAREFEPSVLKTAGLGGSLEDGPFDPLLIFRKNDNFPGTK